MSTFSAPRSASPPRPLPLFRFQGILVAPVHALSDSGHHRGGEIERGVQHLFWDIGFPGGRQAVVHSGLAVSDAGDRDADEFFLAVGQKLGGVGVAVEFPEVGLSVHAGLLCGRDSPPGEMRRGAWNSMARL